MLGFWTVNDEKSGAGMKLAVPKINGMSSASDDGSRDSPRN